MLPAVAFLPSHTKGFQRTWQMVHHQATGLSKAVSNDNFQPSLFPQTCSILICRAKKSQSLVLLCLWHLKRQSNCFFSTPWSSASQNAGGRTDCTGCAWVQRGIISSLYQHLKINLCKEGAVGSMSSVQWPVLYLWSHYGMATQITYSLIYTTHKLFPFIVARLCLLAIKRNVPQTALETRALYPQQT